MFDWPFDWLSFAAVIAAFVLALKAFRRVDQLRARIDTLEAALARAATAPAPPPLAPLQETDATLAASPPPIPTVEQPATPVEPTSPTSPEQVTATEAASATAAPPPVPAAAPGFEERIGTRWVVWIGGLTLALGGFFMVRYSIEAGLLGPGVRTTLGGLFALALLLAGEWTRRSESIADIEALPIANIPAILTAAGTAVAFATVYAAYALYDFLAPAPAFVALGLVALGTLAAALLHGPALAGLGVAAAFVTPVLVSSSEPDFWSLYIYLAIVTAAAFGLARVRLWRWLAITTIVFALLWTLPCLDCGPSMIAPHLFHAIAGFVLAALLVVCGFAFGPAADGEQVEPISSGALAAYLFAAMMIVLYGHHADSAMIAFGLLVAGTLFVAWRAPAATGALAAAAAFVFAVFVEWAVRANPDMLVLPGGAMPGIGAFGDRWIGLAASLHRSRLRGRIWRDRLPGAGPFQRRQGHRVLGRLRGVHAARAADRALCPHRASRPLDPVRHHRRAARRRLWRRDRDADPPRGTARTADRDRTVCDRHARRAGARLHLLAGKRLAQHRAGADVDGHGLDFGAAANPLHADAGRDPRRHRDGADRL